MVDPSNLYEEVEQLRAQVLRLQQSNARLGKDLRDAYRMFAMAVASAPNGRIEVDHRLIESGLEPEISQRPGEYGLGLVFQARITRPAAEPTPASSATPAATPTPRE